SSWCVVSTTVPPSTQCAARCRSSCAVPCVSSAVNGSSRIHSGGGSGRYRRASATRRCWPADSAWQGVSSKPRRPTAANAGPMAAPATPACRAPSQARFSSLVNSALMPAAWPIHSSLAASAPPRGRAGSRPNTCTRPVAGRASPHSRRSRLLLPQPLGPRTRSMSPGQSWKLTSEKRRRWSRSQPRSAALSTGPASVGAGRSCMACRSVGSAFGKLDLVADVVLAGRLVHGNALEFLQGLAVVDDQGALGVPDAQEQVAAVAGELDVRGVLAGHGPQRMGDFEGLLVDEVHRVVVGAEENVGPGVLRVAVAAHEEPRSLGGDFLHQSPGFQVEHRYQPLADVGGGEYPALLALPVNAGPQVRHARQRDVGDRGAGVQVDDLAALGLA